MTRPSRSLADLWRQQGGTTIVEFAMVILPLSLVLTAFLDLGHRIYLEAQLQGTIQQAARLAAIGDTSGDEIDAFVRQSLDPLTDPDKIEISKRSYSNFSDVGKPEKITSDTDPQGAFNEGDCFEDANGNGSFDASGGREGLGGADDILRYEVRITYPRIVPVGVLGWSPEQTLTANTVIRNQPYATQDQPAVVCTAA